MKQDVWYQEGAGNWKHRVDDVPFFKYWTEQFMVWRHIIIPYYWESYKERLSEKLEDLIISV